MATKQAKVALSWKSKRVWLLSVLAAVIIVGIGITGAWWYAMSRNTNVKPVVASQQFDNDTYQADKLWNEGKYAEEVQYITKYMDTHKLTSIQRHDILLSLAMAYYSDNKKDAAQSAALDAVTAGGSKTSSNVYAVLALISKDKGDKKQAIAYYRDAVVATKKSPEPTDDHLASGYEQVIRDLGGTP